MGGSTALTAGKVAVREVGEEVVERAARETLEAGAEKAGGEALEAGAKRTAAETLEQLAKHEGGDIAKVVDGSIDDIAEQVVKKPSYKIGQSDGGPGTWENRHSPKKGAEYQKKTTGAPDDTEYVVKTDKMKSGEKKYDGYDPETNTLQDSKDWDKWPPSGDSKFDQAMRDKEVRNVQKDAQIAADNGANLEYHVPTEAKKQQILEMLGDDIPENFDIIVSHK